MLVLAPSSTAQIAVEVGMRFLEIVDDLEVDAPYLRKIHLLHVHQAQQLAHGLGHLAAAFIARATALGHPDLGPELLLIQAKTTPNLARIKHTFEEFHELSSITLFNDKQRGKTFPRHTHPDTIGIIVDQTAKVRKRGRTAGTTGRRRPSPAIGPAPPENGTAFARMQGLAATVAAFRRRLPSPCFVTTSTAIRPTPMGCFHPPRSSSAPPSGGSTYWR